MPPPECHTRRCVHGVHRPPNRIAVVVAPVREAARRVRRRRPHRLTRGRTQQRLHLERLREAHQIAGRAEHAGRRWDVVVVRLREVVCHQGTVLQVVSGRNARGPSRSAARARSAGRASPVDRRGARARTTATSGRSPTRQCAGRLPDASTRDGRRRGWIVRRCDRGGRRRTRRRGSDASSAARGFFWTGVIRTGAILRKVEVKAPRRLSSRDRFRSESAASGSTVYESPSPPTHAHSAVPSSYDANDVLQRARSILDTLS